MAKIPEIFGSAPVANQQDSSGGGGPVEAIFWARESQTQWRFKGEAFVVGPDIDAPDSKGAQLVKEAIGKRMRRVKECAGDDVDHWSWSRELTAHFGNISPTMRGTFKNPPPGTLVHKPLEDKRLALGQIVTNLHDEVARTNFRVIIIKPDEVEYCYFSKAVQKRLRYSYVETYGDNTGEWKVEEIWP
ncbi:hypothetical protein K3495_g13630 [Podosphaera aphanis]|nr:hypothetical protein K3495_g13630 [Podosphaera aphanis]